MEDPRFLECERQAAVGEMPSDEGILKTPGICFTLAERGRRNNMDPRRRFNEDQISAAESAAESHRYGFGDGGKMR